MVKKFKGNDKGFTLVELLAVIVILALIMGIAVVSMSGVLDSAKTNTMKRTAGSMIDGVRQRLFAANKLDVGDYYFNSKIIEKGGDTSPKGGNYIYATTAPESSVSVTSDIYKIASATCSDTSQAFVRVTKDANGNFQYAICLAAGDGNYYFNLATEKQLLDDSSSAGDPIRSE